MQDFADKELHKDSSWLTNLLLREEDSLYEDAALSERLSPLGLRPKVWTSLLTFLIMLAIGIGLGSVARLVQETRPAVESKTINLQEQVRDLQQSVKKSEARVSKLQSEIEQLREYVIPTNNLDLRQKFDSAALAGGYVTVKGSGIEISFREQAGASGSDLVLDVDLLTTINGLWEAGAKAISINQHRITATTPIRNAGSAVLVNYQPLSRPITIKATGQEELLDRFNQTDAAIWLIDMEANYPIDVTISPASKIKLPAAAIPSLDFSERVTR